MSLMWMPAQTTVPPLSTARRACTTSGPTGAKMSASLALGARLALQKPHDRPCVEHRIRLEWLGADHDVGPSHVALHALDHGRPFARGVSPRVRQLVAL